MIEKRVQISVVSGGKNCDWLMLAADSFARLKRLLGERVRFYTPPNEFSQVFNISAESPEIDSTVTAPVIAHLITLLQQSGDVYVKNTECTVCEQCGRPESGKVCSGCGGNVVRTQRACFFLRLHHYTRSIAEILRTEVILPSYQRNDLVNSFNNRSHEDILIAVAVSREEREFFPTAWFNFLALNLSLCNYPGDEGAFVRLWPETYIFAPRDLQDYIFYWCGIILALQIPNPGGFVCHNYLQIKDRKGQEVSPLLLAKNYGYQGLRFFMSGVKAAPGENSYTEDQVIQKINLDLANELGNLVSRVISLVSRFGEGMIPAPDILTRQTGDLDLRETALDMPRKVAAHILGQELFLAVKTIKNLVGKTNRFIESTLPWQLAESPGQQARLNTVLYNLCEALRFLAVALKPLLPEAAQNILQQLGLDSSPELTSWISLDQWGLIPVGSRIFEQPPLFPRIVPGYGGIGPEPDLIMREELARINMVAARIVSAEKVPDYEGLFQLILYDGRQRCRVLAPVAHSYSPEFLSGRKVVLIANLRPLEIEGLHSEGEVLVAESEPGNLVLVFIDDEVPEGSKILCLS